MWFVHLICSRKRGGNPGPFIPTLTKHGTITSLTDPENPKVLTGKEWLIAQGEPIEGTSEVFESFIGPALCELPSCEQKKLAGNSFEATCWVFLSSTVCRTSLENLTFRHRLRLKGRVSMKEVQLSLWTATAALVFLNECSVFRLLVSV